MPNIKPEIIGTEVDAGQVHMFNTGWEKCNTRKGKKLLRYTDSVPDVDIFEDEIIEDLVLEKKA